MVHSITPEDECKLLDKQKAKRFSYNGSKKIDPWSKCNSVGNSNNFTGNAHVNKSYGKLQNHQLLVNNSYDKQKSMKSINLDNVWSIRNNVPFAQKPSSPVSRTVKPSLYSRYKMTNPTEITPANKEPSSVQTYHNNEELSGSWNTKASNFSYSESTQKASTDYQLANVITDNLQSQKVESGRPITARTKRAQKMHDAYLKSRGLGKYATSTSYTYN